jgi:hypothetical protein
MRKYNSFPGRIWNVIRCISVIIFCIALLASVLLAITSSSYNLKTSVLNQGGGISTSTDYILYSVIGQSSIGEVSSTSFVSGEGYIYTILGRLAGTEYDIHHVYAKTDRAGEEIQPSIWTKDADPYFYWTPPKIRPPELISGYSFSLDSFPDDTIDTQNVYYQYPPASIESGEHTFYVKAQSASSGLWGRTGIFNIWIDVTEPVISDMNPEAGGVTNEERPQVSCTLSDNHSGVDSDSIEMLVGIEEIEPVNFNFDEKTGRVIYEPVKAIGDGEITVIVRAQDKVGNFKELTWGFTIDTKNPTGTILINNDEAVTYSQIVTLTLDADPGIGGTPITQMIISNDGIFDTENWQSYKEDLEWILPALPGIRTVWVKFKDEAGNESLPVSDSIELIILYPETYIISGPAGVTDQTSATFTYAASKSGSVFSYQFDKEEWSDFTSEVTVTRENLPLGNHYFKVKAAYDANGNEVIDEEEIDPTPAQRTWIITETGSLTLEEEKRPIKFWKWE